MNYLLDVSYILYRGYYTFKNSEYTYPEIFALVKKIESLLSSKDSIIYLCLDGRNTKGKALIKEEYKKGREHTYNVYEALPEFIELISNFKRVKVAFNNNLEADEIMFSLSRQLKDKCRIVSGDKDLIQSLNESTSIETGKGDILTIKSYYLIDNKFFDVSPERLPIYRAIVGDTSDNLKPPVPRFPHKLASEISKCISYNGNTPEKGDLEALEFLNDKDKSWIDKLILSYDKFKTNFEIMKLNTIPLEELFNPYFTTDKRCLSEELKFKIAMLEKSFQ